MNGHFTPKRHFGFEAVFLVLALRRRGLARSVFFRLLAVTRRQHVEVRSSRCNRPRLAAGTAATDSPMRQARATTIFLPSSSRALDKWNSAFAQADQDQQEHHEDDVFEYHLARLDLKDPQYNRAHPISEPHVRAAAFHDAAHARPDCPARFIGRWQLHRAAEKQVLFDAFAAGSDATRTIGLETPKVPRYSQVEADGHYRRYAPDLDRQHGQCRRAGLFP